MKSIVTEGTVELTPCEQCQKLVPATYSYGPVEHEGLIVEDVMRAVCNQCGDIVATTPQSAHRFREAIQNRNAKRTTVRIPQELQDFICLNLSAAGCVVLAWPAPAAQWPDRPIRLIAGGAGSVTDIRARWLAERLGAALGQPVIVENNAAAGGSLAAEQE